MKPAQTALLALAGILLLSPLAGCNQRTLFRDDLATERRVRAFDSYDGESAKVSAERRKQADNFGFGPPTLFGNGGQ